MSQLAIETENLSRYFGQACAVNGVALKVLQGSVYGFLGPNGAGKSTTIKMLTGLLAPSSGRIQVLGMDPWNPQQGVPLKQRIGVVPEGLALFDHLTAREYLTFVGRMYLMPRDVIKQRSEELLEVLALSGVEKKLTLEYSHGMKKKLALAGALLPNPDLLFLDEPFEGVDAVTSRTIRELLAKYAQRGSTVFITSHVLEIVERICSHAGIISQGKLVSQSSLDDLRRHSSLERVFLETVGSSEQEDKQVSWLQAAADTPGAQSAGSTVAEAAGTRGDVADVVVANVIVADVVGGDGAVGGQTVTDRADTTKAGNNQEPSA